MKSRPKVCLIVGHELPLPSVKGGAIETLMTSLIKQNEIFGELDLTVVSPYDREAKKAAQQFKKTQFLFIKKGLIYQLLRVLCKFSNYVRGTYLFAYNQLALAKLKKKSFDYIIVEGGADQYFTSFLRFFEQKQMVYHLHCNGRTNSQVDATFGKIIGVSDYVVDVFRQDSQIKRFDVVRNGIESDLFLKKITESGRQRIRRQLGLKSSDFIVLYVGRIIEIKGVSELVEAFDQIDDQQIKLVMVGATGFSGSKTNDFSVMMQKKIADNPQITAVGYVNNQEMSNYYGIADMQVISSTCEEASPLVVIEGMLSKLPIVATRSGGLTEIAKGRAVVIDKEDRQQMVRDLAQAIVDIKNQVIKLDIEQNYRYAQRFSAKNYYHDFVVLIKDYQQTDDQL